MNAKEDQKYTQLTDISFLNSAVSEDGQLMELFENKLFQDESQWGSFQLSKEIDGLMDNIKARMKYYMSKLSLGVYNVLDMGPGKNICPEDEIYLFSGFTEIGTVSKIGDIIMTDDYSIPPSLFPNSVQHISLCYYTILKKICNYTTTITDGMLTNFSFINFIKNRVQLDMPFIVVSGEEHAAFFEYEEDKQLEIVPSFVSFKVVPYARKGFYYGGKLSSLNEIMELPEFKGSGQVFVNKDLFEKLKPESNKEIYSDYPITGDNPCSVIYRLAMPFYFNISGRSIVIEEVNGDFHYFIVNL